VQLVELLVKMQPDWLPARPAVFTALWERWKIIGSVWVRGQFLYAWWPLVITAGCCAQTGHLD
jgi:hypothetical protein